MAILVLHRLIKFNQISPFSGKEGGQSEEAGKLLGTTGLRLPQIGDAEEEKAPE